MPGQSTVGKIKCHQGLPFSERRRKTLRDQLPEAGASHGGTLSGNRCAGGRRDRCTGGMDQRGSVQRLAAVAQGSVRVHDQLLRDSIYHYGIS